MDKRSSIFLLFLCTLLGCADCSSSGRKSQRRDRLTNTLPKITTDLPKNTEGSQLPTPNEEIRTRSKSNTPQSKDLSSVVQQAEPCVFVVYALDAKGNTLGQGTGFFIAASGIGVTNHHVFKPGVQWVIKTFNGQTYRVKNIIRQSERYDFVVFETAAPANVAFPYLQTAQQTPRKGDEVLILGNPEGLESTLSRGIVSSIRPLDNPDDLIQTDAAISHGSSGSPVMNMLGEVVGIATLKIKECENCNFAYNIKLIR